MQAHHSQAVEMALIEYAATTDEDLRFTAYDIATGQAAQGGEMYGLARRVGCAAVRQRPADGVDAGHRA